MSLDVMLRTPAPEGEGVNGEYEVYGANITHNLSRMAEEAGIYNHLWCPEDLGIKRASELIAPLEAGLVELRARPAYFRLFDSPNGWGVYENFVPFVDKYLEACRKYPDSRVVVSR